MDTTDHSYDCHQIISILFSLDSVHLVAWCIWNNDLFDDSIGSTLFHLYVLSVFWDPTICSPRPMPIL
jgi:hypothetical protein